MILEVCIKLKGRKVSPGNFTYRNEVVEGKNLGREDGVVIILVDIGIFLYFSIYFDNGDCFGLLSSPKHQWKYTNGSLLGAKIDSRGLFWTAQQSKT